NSISASAASSVIRKLVRTAIPSHRGPAATANPNPNLRLNSQTLASGAQTVGAVGATHARLVSVVFFRAVHGKLSHVEFAHAHTHRSTHKANQRQNSRDQRRRCRHPLV